MKHRICVAPLASNARNTTGCCFIRLSDQRSIWHRHPLYAPNLGIDQFRRTAIYVDKILREVRNQPISPSKGLTKYQLAINLNTAKALGLEVPFHIQQLADEVIE